MRAASNVVIALSVLALAFAIRIYDPLAPKQAHIAMWVCLALVAAATFMGILLDRKRRVAQFAGGLLGVFGLLGLLTASASDAIHSIGASVAGAGVALLLASLFLDLHPEPAQSRPGWAQERPMTRRKGNTHSRPEKPSEASTAARTADWTEEEADSSTPRREGRAQAATTACPPGVGGARQG